MAAALMEVEMSMHVPWDRKPFILVLKARRQSGSAFNCTVCRFA